MTPGNFRSLSLAALAFLLLAAPAAAVQSTVDLLLDLDDDTTTGCTVTTPDGPFDGVEQILSTTVDTTGAAMATVTLVERSECVDPGTDTFGPSIPVDPGGWPVGVGLGVDGFHVVETYLPLSATPLELKVVRIGVVHTRGAEVDTLLVAAPGTETPILLDLRSVLEIPTLGEWGLILLALLLAASSLLLLGRRGMAALVTVLLLATAGVAWAQCMLDGVPDEWSVADLLGEDPAAADDGLSIRTVFGKGEVGLLCLRADVSLTFDEPPTITDIADQTIPEDGTTGPLAFTVGDAEDAATALTVTATSSNQILVPDGNLTFGGAGANRTITVTPAANQNGMTMVTVTVEDTAGGTASTTFQVTVTSDNDPPTITAIADQAILEDSTTGPLAFTVDDVETAAGSLTVTASSNDQTIIPDGNLVLGGSGANRTINVTPAADANGGPVTITVLVQDTDGGSTPGQFDVTVTPVNDAPSFALAGDDSSDEDAGPQVVPNQATAISPGPTDEAGQTVTFQVTNDNNALFSSQPAIDAAGTLTYQAAANANGSAVVTVTAVDDGGTANGGVNTSAAQMFTITVDPVNDPPVAADETVTAACNIEHVVETAPGETAAATGNVFRTVADNVLVGDSDPVEGTAVSIVQADGTTSDTTAPFQITTNEGGNLTLHADGSFTYTPEAADRSVADSFTYTIQDADGAPDVATVTLNVGSVCTWFVDNSVSGVDDDGTGTSSDPFTSLVDEIGPDADPDDAEDASMAGDVIYVFEGDSTSGDPYQGDFVAKANQRLLGQGVDLVVDFGSGPETLFTGNPANRPLVDDSDGDAVQVIDVTGVEVAGLELDGADNALQVTSATAATSVHFHDNRIAGSGAEAIDLNPGSSGAFTATIENNTFATSSATGNAIDVTTAAANAAAVEVAIEGNADITSSGGTAIHLDGSLGTGTLFVTGFAGNTVHGNTAGAGVMVTDATFDADPSDADFTGDEVAAGNTSVGSGANPVGGSAMMLTDVAGDLAFGTLDLFTEGMGEVGLAATGTGTLNAGAGTGFEITSTGGTIDSANGPAVDLDPLTAGLTFGSVSSGNSGVHGIRLRDVAGSFTATGGTLASSAGSAIRVTGTTPGDSTVAVNLSGMTINHAAGVTPVIFGQNSSGLFSLTGSTISKGGGRVLDFDDMDGGSSFTGTTVTSTNHHGKRIIDSQGVHDLPNVQINTAPPMGVDALHLANNAGATINVPRLEVTTNGSRGLFANNGGTLNVTGATNQITTTGHSAVEMSNTAVGGSGITFASLSATGTGTNEGIDLDGVGGGTFQVTGTTTVNGTGAGQNAIDVATSGATFTFASIDVDNPGGTGVALTNNTGPVTINGGDVTGAAGNAFDVAGGTHDVAYAGTINNTAGKAVEITGRGTAGRTVTLSGNVTHDDGAGGGANAIGIDVNGNSNGTTVFSGASKVINSGTAAAVTLANNGGHTVRFTNGGLDVDATSGGGFSATAGGNVEVSGGGNTVDTMTGLGINIANTAIDALGVTFASVSVDGAPSGIVLDNTGANPLEVTGEGASDPTVVVGTRGRTLSLNGGGTMSGFGTGGVIRNTTGDGVSLSDTNAVLRNLTIGDPTATVGQAADGTTSVGDDGVSVTGNGSLMLDNVLISRTATHGIRATNTSNVTILNTEVLNAGTAIDEDGADFTELLGTSSITSSVFDGMHSRGIDVQNDTKTSAVTPDALTVVNTRITNSDAIAGENAIRFRSLASGNFSLTVHDSLIHTVEGNGIGVFSNGNNAVDPSNAHLEVRRTTITGTGAPNVTVPTAIQVNPAFEGSSTFDILDNNPMDGGGFSGIPTAGIIIKNDSNGLLRGTIANNSVSSGGEGAFVVADGAIGMTMVTGNVQITVSGNTFTSSGAHGMSFSAQDGAVGLEAKIGGNTTTAGGPAFSFQNGIFMDVQTGTACFNLATAAGAGNNVATGAGSGEGIFLQKTGGSVILQGFGGGNDAAAATFLNNNNTSNPAAFVFSGDTVGTGACSNTP